MVDFDEGSDVFTSVSKKKAMQKCKILKNTTVIRTCQGYISMKQKCDI